MRPYHKIFLREELPQGKRAFLAAFGKHPGWNDHIDDLGIETESLALAKQRIYLEGLSGQIDSGSWDKLDATHRLEEFDHLFLWQRGGDAMLGRIVASRDGKGRARYPMILCAQFAKVPVSFLLRELYPPLEAAMKECRAATTADAVKQVVINARESLRRITGGAPSVTGPEAAPAEAARLVGQASLGPADEGLLRILYQIKNHLAPWAPGRGDVDKSTGASPGMHLRVPRISGREDEVLAAWVAFIGSQLDPNVPCLYLLPRGGTWVDAIVGEPAVADFFGLKANTRAIPSASEVPYEMDEAFRAEAKSLLGDLAKGGAGARTIFGSSGGTSPGRKFGRQSGGASAAVGGSSGGSPSGGGSGRKWLLWGAGGAGGLLGIITVVVLLRGPDAPPPSPTAAAPAASVAPPTATSTPAPTVTAKTAQAPAAVVTAPVAANPMPVAGGGTADIKAEWKSLCRSYADWVIGLQAALKDRARRERWARDSHLQSAVLALIGPAGQPDPWDPRVIAGVSGELSTFGDAPPAGLAEPATALKVRAALRGVEQLGAALAAWAVPAQASAHVAKLSGWGWSPATADLRLPEKLALGTDLAANVDRVLEASGPLAAVMPAAEAVDAGVKRLGASGDPALTAAGAALMQEAASAGSLRDLKSVLERLRGEIDPVVAVLGGDWDAGKIDRERFLRERGAAWNNGVTGVALLKKWKADVANYAQVADASAALPTADWQQALARAKSSQGLLATVAPAEVGPFAARLAKLEKDWSALGAARVVRSELAARTASSAALVTAMKALAADLSGEVGRRANPAAWVQQLRTVKVAESAVVDGEWQRQRDEILRTGSPEALQADLKRFVELRARAEQVEAYLRQLATASSLPETFSADEVPDAGVARDLRARAHSRREVVLGKLLSEMTIWKQDGLPAESAAEFWQKSPVRSLVADYVKEYQEARGFGTDIAQIVGLLDDGCAWQDQAGKAFAPWRDQWGKEAGSKTMPRIAELVTRFAQLERLTTSTDRAQLTLAARSALLAESVTAWRRLGELPEWLADPADLTAEQQMASALKTRGESEIKNPAHRPAFQKDLAAQGRNRWKAALGRAKSDAAMARLFGAMDSFGVNPADLGAAEKFNLELSRLKSKPWGSLNKDEGRAARDQAITALRAVAMTDPNQVSTLIADLEKIDFAEGQANPGAEGPAKSGWTLEAPTRPDVLTYVWKNPANRVHRLEFVAVPLPSGQNSYVCATEMPVQLFLDWVEHKGLWKGVIDGQQGLLDEFEQNDPRRGPRSWAVRKDGARERWRLVREKTNWRVDNLEKYAPGMTAPPPSEQTPLNYVSYTTANLVSRDLNCRLPTESEWQAAMKLDVAQETAPAVPNRRDAVWRKHLEFELQIEARFRCWPDSDIFLPNGTPKELGREAAAKAAVESEDGFLWFADVRGGQARLLSHLIGNVAEYVTDDQGRVGVIGGSALSPRELPVDKFLVVDRLLAQAGFSDVGFRPAFSVGKLSGGMRVQAVLASARFVPLTK